MAQSDNDRLVSLDAYRGFTMLAMVSGGAGGMGLAFLKNNPRWSWLADQLGHRDWVGCTFWDLIQPSFMFIVGVAMPFSFARREGQSAVVQTLRVVKRCLLLIAVGVFLDSYSDRKVYVQFIRVLQQIAIGYLLASLVVRFRPSVQALTAALLLAAHTGAYLLYAKLSGGSPMDGTYSGSPTGSAHGGGSAWERTDNVGTYVDNLLHFYINNVEFFRPSPGGYVTINAISSTATILFGVLAGELLRGPLRAFAKFAILVVVGLAALAAGWALSGGDGWLDWSFQPVVPMIKKLWTASFAIYAAGWTCLMLAAFFLIIDGIRFRCWAFPFVVVGMNSIFMYVLASLLRPDIRRGVSLFLTEDVLGVSLDPRVRGIIDGSLIILVEWLICFWLYRRRIFLRL
jgi:predicted acyltransferase